MLKPKELLAALADIPARELCAVLDEARRKATDEERAEADAKKQAEVDARRSAIASVRELSRSVKEAERKRRADERRREIAEGLLKGDYASSTDEARETTTDSP